MSHMTGRNDVFFKLDRAVQGIVWFGDVLLVEIRGNMTVFEGKNGEHRALSVVYFILRLKNNIISVGQLDECGS